MSNNNKNNIRFYQRIGFRITMIISFSVFFVTLVSMLFIVQSSKTNITNLTKNNIQDLVIAYSSMLEDEIRNNNNDLSYEQYEQILNGVGIKDIKSSYAYLVSSDGIMQYHPMRDKIGSPVENVVISSIVKDLDAGKQVEDAVVQYDFRGVIKYAGYSVLDNSSILVISADRDDVMSKINRMFSQNILICLIAMVICIVTGYLFVFPIIRAINHTTKIIKDVSTLNLHQNIEQSKLIKRKDETGVMARAVKHMSNNLLQIVKDMVVASDTISKNVEDLSSISVEISDMCSDNSATTEEIAASMQETAATTETIGNSVVDIKKNSDYILNLSMQGGELSKEIMERANALKSATDKATQQTNLMYQTIKKNIDDSIESSKAVDQINILIEAIMSISSQTSMLALNASIEAARAGETGKGFAVVASEIGNLAKQTADTVTNIDEIVKHVNDAVSGMAKSLEETAIFLENVVLKDYKQFEDVSVKYSNDAENVQLSMTDIKNTIVYLTNNITNIVNAIDGISNTVNEATLGITDISDKVNVVVSKTLENNSIVENCESSASLLRSASTKFTIE